MTGETSASSRGVALTTLRERVRRCPRCSEPVAGRTTVVFGEGPADAALMVVGQAPGVNEDRQGLPLVGAPARLLRDALGVAGLRVEDVFVTTVLKYRLPDNRDPLPDEVEHGLHHLHEQVAIIRPRVLCPLGGFAAKLLRGDPEGIRTVHGRAEIHDVGGVAVRVLPLFDPAAALYGRLSTDALRADVARLPELLALPVPDQREAVAPTGPDDPDPGRPPTQLGLF
ncbi:MAG: uracil-DNA glycosylase [Solirubrobacteraceae bacterium]